MVLVSNYKHIPLDFCCICISSFVVFVFLFKQNIFVPKLHLYLFFLFLRHDKFVLKVRVSHISIWLYVYFFFDGICISLKTNPICSLIVCSAGARRKAGPSHTSYFFFIGTIMLPNAQYLYYFPPTIILSKTK